MTDKFILFVIRIIASLTYSMHELMHGYHREYSARKHPGEAPDICMKNFACDMMQKLVDMQDELNLDYRKISTYADKSYNTCAFEEVIAEAYTRHILGHRNATVNEFVRRVYYGN